ncbi:MAG: hypothetical protein ACLFTH_02680 [Candidatus Woesearchaeota archaeon]
MTEEYEEPDIDRFSRKVTKLLSKHKGKDFFHILKERTNIKDEFCSLLDIPNSKLEEYIDKALAS